MKNRFIVIFAILFAVLIVTPLLIFHANDSYHSYSCQDKAMDFMVNVLSIDPSKYTIELKIDSTRDSTIRRVDDNRKINSMLYELSSENGNLQIMFDFENDVLKSYVGPLNEQIIITKQYAKQDDAVKGFLERYHPYTKIDSKKFASMLDEIDFAKNSTIIVGNIKLIATTITFWGVEQTRLRWSHTVNGADYNELELIVENDGFVSSMIDTWGLFTVGDTSINVSREQAIDIAIENMYLYAYEMHNGKIVGGFKAHKDNAIAELYTASKDVAYELMPYWKVELLLDEVYPGNVFGITVFIWAGDGEIHSWGNMSSA